MTPTIPPTQSTPSVLKDIWRLAVAYLTSLIISLIAHFGFHTPAYATVVIGAVLGFVIQAVLRWIEKHVPAVGALVGWIGAPSFPVSLKTQLLDAYNSLLLENQSLSAKISAASDTPTAPPAPAQPTPAPATPPAPASTPAGA